MHDNPVASMLRKRKWRAKWREIHRLEKIAERDRRRVAKGLLPLKEANAAKVKQHREKIAALKESITNCWFAPSLDLDAVVSQRIADSPNLDPSTVRGLVAATERNCAANSLNLNAFVLKRGFHIACHARTIFHELIEQGVPLAEAAQRCHRESFKPDPMLSGVSQSLDTCRRFDEARERWGDGSDIVNTLLGR